MSAALHGVQALTFAGDDFQPVVESGGWLVALMNWSPRFDLSGWGEVERHTHTDEVFVLLKGRSVLFVEADGGVELVDMVPGVVYNVLRSTWHNVIGTRDVQWLIVESQESSGEPTEYRALNDGEKTALGAVFPAWLEGLRRLGS
jgi:mannose-6-phosphate isomerase-like protein (cupin superfamily)